jgi:activator of HSP90 ATPase
MPEYKVVPFSVNINANEGKDAIAAQLQKALDAISANEWEYVRMECVETYVKPTSGCFGLGGEQGYFTTRQMLILRRI